MVLLWLQSGWKFLLIIQKLNALHAPLYQMMDQVSVSFVPDRNLPNVYRAAMALSLESHFFLLGHIVVQLAWRLPHYLNLRDVQEKWFLQQVLYRHLPQEITAQVLLCPIGLSVALRRLARMELRDVVQAAA